MLPRLKPVCFYDIVMQVAIIRPGPIQGDMIHPFLRRRSGMEPVTYPHPSLKPILERTLGVPLFQNKGCDGDGNRGLLRWRADELRRAMGHKRSRDRMAQIYPRLVNGMVANGIEREVADRLFHMLEGFADYGFPESHAASLHCWPTHRRTSSATSRRSFARRSSTSSRWLLLDRSAGERRTPARCHREAGRGKC